MTMRLLRILPVAALALLASCASKKAVTDGTTSATTSATASHKTYAATSLAFVQKVSDGRVYTKNIVGGMSFRLQTSGKNVSVSGKLSMRRDQVIRLQLFLPIIGTEVGRLEFTPDHVLLIDRLHKEYVEAGYDKVSFLKENGITFYSLQALFWNQLFLPGKNDLSETDLKTFTADLSGTGTTVPIAYSAGNMAYSWTADRAAARLLSAIVAYRSTAHGNSSLSWQYDDFRSVGAKQFPARQSFTFTTTATSSPQSATVTLEMDNIKTDDSWEATTTVSSKYKRVEADDLLRKLTNF